MPALFAPRGTSFPRPMSVAGPSGGPADGRRIGRFPFEIPSYGPRLHFDIRLDAGNLPLGTLVSIACATCPIRSGMAAAISGFERIPGPDESVIFALEVDHTTSALHPGISGIVPTGEPFPASISVELPAGARPGRYLFGLEHWVGNAFMGGQSWDIRVTSHGEAG